MDIYCPKCAEPMDNDELHVAVDEGKYDSYAEASAAWRETGCASLGYTHNTDGDSDKAFAASALYDLLGDDMDGASAMFEDFEMMGML